MSKALLDYYCYMRNIVRNWDDVYALTILKIIYRAVRDSKVGVAFVEFYLNEKDVVKSRFLRSSYASFIFWQRKREATLSIFISGGGFSTFFNRSHKIFIFCCCCETCMMHWLNTELHGISDKQMIWAVWSTGKNSHAKAIARANHVVSKWDFRPVQLFDQVHWQWIGGLHQCMLCSAEFFGFQASIQIRMWVVWDLRYDRSSRCTSRSLQRRIRLK